MKTEKKEKREKLTWGDIFPKYRISMLDNGRIKRIRIEGAKKLLLCLDGEVKILLREEVLHIFGRELACVSYESGAVEVSGIAERITFEKRTPREGEREE